MPSLRALLRRIFIFIAALLLIFEEWGWEPLAALAARLAKLPVFAWIEERIRKLPPYAALATFFIPALMLVPVKLAALFFIVRGHKMFGVVVIIVAKVVGTAVVARLFTLTNDALMQLEWFAHWYPRWKAWKDRIMDEVRASASWQAAARVKAAVALRWSAFKQSLR